MAQAHTDHHDPEIYFVPHSSRWPLFGSVGLFVAMIGLASWFNEIAWGKATFFVGIAMLAFILFRWFADVVLESVSGYYNKRVDSSFRMGMVWFIFSEIMFFSAFFGALFYARSLSVPWLGGEGAKGGGNSLLWQDYSAAWPSTGPGQLGGMFEMVPAWGLPLLNTLLLLASGVTITIAHHALKADNRRQLLIWLGATILLGCTFLFFQVEEYIHAWSELNLTMGSGIYGSTFYMLTGFHGAHVTLGTIMLIVIWFRCLKGHFSAENHFAFEAVAWYWHFVDVVWLILFLFVYVI
jgi:cytochrome c oxidase subunit 3